MGSLVGAGLAGSSTINSSKKVCNEMSSQRSLAFNHNGATASAHHHSVINSTNSSSMGSVSKAGAAEVVEVIHCVDRHNPNGYFFDLAQQENIFDDDQKRAYKIIFKKYN
jgi:RecA-family ATPase